MREKTIDVKLVETIDLQRMLESQSLSYVITYEDRFQKRTKVTLDKTLSVRRVVVFTLNCFP